MSRALVSLAGLAALMAASASACGGSQDKASRSHPIDLTGTISVVLKHPLTGRQGLRIYDPKGRINAEVRSRDVVRSSVRVARDPNGAVTLFIGLSVAGRQRFCSLTRALAQRGARLRLRQHFAFAVGGEVYAQPWIDYRLFPDGMCGDLPGLQITGIHPPVAQRLARLIRAAA